MADVHTPQVRSYNMSRIRSTNTKSELLVRKFLFSKGLRYRINNKPLPGKPDIVLPKFKTAVFIHGCFWHGHNSCKYFVLPKTRTEWWKEKLDSNRERDIKASTRLEELNWKVITIFECELKPLSRENTLNELLNRIMS